MTSYSMTNRECFRPSHTYHVRLRVRIYDSIINVQHQQKRCDGVLLNLQPVLVFVFPSRQREPILFFRSSGPFVHSSERSHLPQVPRSRSCISDVRHLATLVRLRQTDGYQVLTAQGRYHCGKPLGHRHQYNIVASVL